MYNQINSIPTAWLLWKTSSDFTVGQDSGNESFAISGLLVGTVVSRSVSDSANTGFALSGAGVGNTPEIRSSADSANSGFSLESFAVTGAFDRDAGNEMANSSFGISGFLRLTKISESETETVNSSFALASINV